MADELVVIHNLSKTFYKSPSPAIKNVTLSLPKQGIIGLVGPDGAGKTTLIRLLASLLLPSEGSISIDGHDTVKDAHVISSLIGYMPQKFGLYEDLSVIENFSMLSVPSMLT